MSITSFANIYMYPCRYRPGISSDSRRTFISSIKSASQPLLRITCSKFERVTIVTGSVPISSRKFLIILPRSFQKTSGIDLPCERHVLIILSTFDNSCWCCSKLSSDIPSESILKRISSFSAENSPVLSVADLIWLGFSARYIYSPFP